MLPFLVRALSAPANLRGRNRPSCPDYTHQSRLRHGRMARYPMRLAPSALPGRRTGGRSGCSQERCGRLGGFARHRRQTPDGAQARRATRMRQNGAPRLGQGRTRTWLQPCRDATRFTATVANCGAAFAATASTRAPEVGRAISVALTGGRDRAVGRARFTLAAAGRIRAPWNACLGAARAEASHRHVADDGGRVRLTVAV